MGGVLQLGVALPLGKVAKTIMWVKRRAGDWWMVKLRGETRKAGLVSGSGGWLARVRRAALPQPSPPPCLSQRNQGRTSKASWERGETGSPSERTTHFSTFPSISGGRDPGPSRLFRTGAGAGPRGRPPRPRRPSGPPSAGTSCWRGPRIQGMGRGGSEGRGRGQV